MKVRIKSFNVVSTGSAASLSPGAQILTTMCRIKALAANSGIVHIGDSTGQTYELSKGEELDVTEIFEKDGGSADVDIAELFMLASSGDGVCVLYADRDKTLSFRS